MNEKQKEIQEKCIAFAVRADKLRRYLNKEKKEYNKADQVDRSASARGALYSEAIHAESEADYIHKLGIAQKEANETVYWLKVIYKCGYIDDKVYESLVADAEELYRVITAIIVAMKKKS